MVSREVIMPSQLPKKIEDCYVTLNGYGLSFCTLNSFGHQLIKSANKDLPILDIGAAYGVFTLEALKHGAQVIANDLSPEHLQLLKSRAPLSHHKRLSLCEGYFPSRVDIIDQSLSAVYACGVLHYLPPQQFTEALCKIYNALDEKGLLCIVTTSPYLGGYEEFVPSYEKRYREGRNWPGLINNSHEYFTPPNFAYPRSVNVMDCKVLERAVSNANFKIIKLGYISIKGIYSRLYTNGKELSAVIAIKN